MIAQKLQSPFGAAATQVCANGYHVVPIMPGNKAPGLFTRGHWQPMAEWEKWRDQKPEGFIIKLWGNWDGAGIGVVLGTKVSATHEIGAIDYDTDDPSILEIMESSLPVSTVQKRGKRGYTAFYLLPIGTKGKRYRRSAQTVCEILTGNGTRQTVIPPSVHPETGEPYRWITGATLENTRACDLVALSADDLERFTDTLAHLALQEAPDERRAPVSSDADQTPHRALNDAALANLDWFPKLGLPKARRTAAGYVAVPVWRPSSTGRPTEARSPNLGVSREGIRDFGTGAAYTPLDLVMASQGWDLEWAFKFLSNELGLAEDGFGEDLLAQALQHAPSVPAVSMTPEGDTVDPETGEIIQEAGAPVPSGGELPDALTRVPGLVGDVTDWIVATARQPNRVLALGAAITIIGTLIGRRVAGPTLSGTHLYVVGLAPSGVGKDHPLRAVDMLMKAANAGHLVGPDDFMSMTAVVNVLQRSPLSLCAMDEFGAMLGKISHRRASPHEKGITKILRSAWGASFKTMRTPEWGAKASEEIVAPAMSLFGISVPGEFFKALTGDDVTNGFLNRFLMLATETKARAVKPKSDPLTVPKALATDLAALYARANAISPGEIADPFAPPRPRVIGADRKADAALKLLEDEMEVFRASEETEAFFARTGEMAIRLATIRAAGRGADLLSVEDVQWGRELAIWSARKMAEAAGEYMAENEFADFGNRIVRFVRKRGGHVSRRDIQKHLKSALKVRELADILDTLVEAGRLAVIRPAKDEKPTPGRPAPPVLYAATPAD